MSLFLQQASDPNLQLNRFEPSLTSPPIQEDPPTPARKEAAPRKNSGPPVPPKRNTPVTPVTPHQPGPDLPSYCTIPRGQGTAKQPGSRKSSLDNAPPIPVRSSRLPSAPDISTVSPDHKYRRLPSLPPFMDMALENHNKTDLV